MIQLRWMVLPTPNLATSFHSRLVDDIDAVALGPYLDLVAIDLATLAVLHQDKGAPHPAVAIMVIVTEAGIPPDDTVVADLVFVAVTIVVVETLSSTTTS